MVQSKAESVWKWEMYRLVEEFDRKPTLPAPLVLFETVFRVAKMGWKVCCRTKKENRERRTCKPTFWNLPDVGNYNLY